jgi:RimJ/RimL family protein N-acetyltransferase
MRLNETVAIVTNRLTLVAYRREHVPRYHEWMQNAELRQLTASDELTLEEEFDNQRSWHLDENKLTFIVLLSSTDTSSEASMIGDVNLHINGMYDAGVGEIEIMIADTEMRGRGLAKEALCAMMQFAAQRLHVTKFIAKIKQHNVASRRLFESLGFVACVRSDDDDDDDDGAVREADIDENGKGLIGRANVFGEVELELSSSWLPPMIDWHCEEC